MHKARHLVLAAAIAALPALSLAAGGLEKLADKKINPQVERGHYLVMIGGCNDCHTPLMMTEHGPVPDVSRALSGRPADAPLPPAPKGDGPWNWGGSGDMTAFWGPWGITYSANITSDKETGIGAWTAEQFIATMKTGKHLGTGRPILPPMPWPSLSAAKEEDLRAMFAYLQSTKPIRNAVPAPVINPPPSH